MVPTVSESETILIGARLYLPAEAVGPQPAITCGAGIPEDWVEYEVQGRR